MDLTGQQLQQGRLARAIAADQGDALAGFDGQTDIFQQQRAADAVIGVLQGNQGLCDILRAARGLMVPAE